MHERLLLFASILSIVSCAHVCREDGQFPNPDDPTSYIECIDGKEYFRRCARGRDGLSYLVFDGRECAESSTSFACPQSSGSYRYLGDDTRYYECIDRKAILRQCPEGTIFDGLACAQPTGPIDEFGTQEFPCPRSSGVFANPKDPYRFTYYECANSVSTKRNCPSFTIIKDGRYQQERMVFDGHSCIKPAPESPDRRAVNTNRRPVYEDPRYPGPRVTNRRQVPEYRCPVNDGIYQSVTDPNTWYECAGGEALRIYTCEPGQSLDIVTRICRGTTVRDEEVVVHRPETVSVESSPRVVELQRQPPRDNTFYPDRDRGYYYGRRYRRNGRVELEDQYTGAVIVDTWNEGAWRWDRNMNGQRLPLPLVNEWRSYYEAHNYQPRAGEAVPLQPEPALEYRRPPVRYVYRPDNERRYYQQ